MKVMMFSKPKSMRNTIRAITREADSTTIALLLSSDAEGQLTLCTSSLYDSLQ